MHTQAISRLLLPGSFERDPAFRQELAKVSRFSLRLIGGLQMTVPAFMLLAGLSVVPVRLEGRGPMIPSLAVIAVGILTFTASLGNWSRRPARFLACLSVWITSAILAWSALVLGRDVLWIEHYMVGYITLVTLGAVAGIPMQPPHTFALGISIQAVYLVLWLASQQQRLPFQSDLGFGQHVFIFVVILTGTFLSGLVYRQRAANFRAHQQALHNAESLRDAQCRLLLSENAATVGRLAAALAHELNSPVGAVASAVETLLALSPRQAVATAEERERLAGIMEEARLSVRESTQRLREIVARMQRFTNLDRSEVQPTNLNELLNDVVQIIEPQAKGRVQIELNFQPLPTLMCRPQQLSAVFSSLVVNAVEAVEGQGYVRIATRRAESQLEVRVEDNGRGMSREELDVVFDPGFRVTGSRITTGHWSLFSARQIVHEHGGEIRISSEAGQGTTVVVTLPC
jgi:signal transduction histidine kinase